MYLFQKYIICNSNNFKFETNEVNRKLESYFYVFMPLAFFFGKALRAFKTPAKYLLNIN